MARARHVGGWLGTGLAAIGLLAAGAALQGWLPGDDDPGSEPFVRTAGVGDPVDLRTATVTVEDVTGSRTVSDFGTDKVSPGLWLAVGYTVTARDENTTITFVQLADTRGRTWDLAGRSTNACADSPPGVPVRCTAYVEVPADAVPGIVVRLARQSRDQRYDVVAEVDLGLTGTDAEVFDGAEPLDVVAPVVGGAEAAS